MFQNLILKEPLRRIAMDWRSLIKSLMYAEKFYVYWHEAIWA